MHFLIAVIPLLLAGQAAAIPTKPHHTHRRDPGCTIVPATPDSTTSSVVAVAASSGAPIYSVAPPAASSAVPAASSVAPPVYSTAPPAASSVAPPSASSYAPPTPSVSPRAASSSAPSAPTTNPNYSSHLSVDFSSAYALPSWLTVADDSIGASGAGSAQQYTSANVAVNGGFLKLTCPGGQQKGSTISGAQVITNFEMLYASVRTTAYVSSVGGTTHGNFFYKNDNAEIDIEIMTDGQAAGMWYTNQPSVPGGQPTDKQQSLPADATTKLHEYRIDWLPDKTEFYLDGSLQTTLTTNVPAIAGHWLWNNWSNGDAGWSAGPPASDNVWEIQKIEVYYNPA